MRLLRNLSCVAVVVTLFAGLAHAQYFGQNRVRFKPLDFEVLKTTHFDIHYYPEEREAAQMVGQMAERWYTRLSQVLNHELPPEQPIILYDSHPAFRQTTVVPEEIGVGTGGLTEGLKRRVVLPMAGSLAETDHVLGHELVHAFQYDMTKSSQKLSGGVPEVAALPLWFVEGMAEYLSMGAVDPHTAMWLRDSVQREKLPQFADLDKPEFFPYRFGQAFWAYVGGRFGDDVIGRMLLAAGRSAPDRAVQSVLRVTPEELERDWHRALSDQYETVLQRNRLSSVFGRTIVAAKPGGMSVNVSPSLSPDGKQVVVFSQHNAISMDLYLLDASTGGVIKTLTRTAVDPHLDSLEFIYGSGAWSRDGKCFAFSTLSTGKPKIIILSMPRGDETQEIPVAGVAEIFTLTWSPDGRRIAFSGMTEGYSDLFELDVSTHRLERLTNDAFADLHPAYSPDGHEIAFATERFGGDLDSLSFGKYRLAVLDLQKKVVRPLPTFSVGKQTNPQWSRDGAQIFFISDRNGISNIYSLRVEDGSIRQWTNLDTGVSGIAALSPAISSAAQSDRLMFSLFNGGSYSLNLLESSGEFAGGPVRDDFSFEVAGSLPPIARENSAVAQLLRQPRVGLVETSTFANFAYRPKLALDYVAPPSIEVGSGVYGSAVGGGTALYWSDLLGQHNLMTSIGAMAFGQGNPLRNLSGTAAYLNQKSRWNWGVVGGQAPLISEGYGTTLSVVGGNPVVVDNALRVWQIERHASGVLSYPFDRTKRLEFSTGYRNIAFAARQEQSIYSATTGELIAIGSGDLPTAPSLHMATAGTAFVFDSSVSAGVSPIWGQRYRFEISANHGSLTYTTALADYRRYFRLPAKLTFAGRLLHFGRYGGGAEDYRLQDLSLEYGQLVRGYGLGSFSSNECGPRLQIYGDCPVLNQLFGSRIAVANAELRLPVLGPLAAFSSRRFPPVEAAGFYDVGAAWKKAERNPNFENVSGNAVKSYGATLRVNLLGITIGQMSYVHPLDRGRGWHFEFAFTSGF